MGSIRQAVFRNGEPVPASKPNTWRLYSMRFCPFAQRTRLVLAHKNIQYETVNVHLKEKPDWFVKKNPLGTVPIVEKDDTIVHESAICNDYLEELFPEKPLYPKDTYKKARMKILMERCGKVISSFYAIAGAGQDEEKRNEAVKTMLAQLQPFEDALQGKFFGGDELSMLDIHIWPWFERMVIFESGGQDLLKNLPKLKNWTSNMRSHPTVQALLSSGSIHVKFMQSLMTPNPNYDIGL